MDNIKIAENQETSNGWHFLVQITDHGGTSEHEVNVDEEYWRDLTEEEMEPEQLVREAFSFLLEREPKEAVMNEFDLRDIAGYFPDFEAWVSR